MNIRTTTLPRALLLLCLILTLCSFSIAEQPALEAARAPTSVWSLSCRSPFSQFSPSVPDFFEIPLDSALTYEVVGSADLLSKEDFDSLSATGIWGITAGVNESGFRSYGVSIPVAQAVAAVKPYVPLGIQFNCDVTPDDIVAAHDALPGCRYLALQKMSHLGAGVLQRISAFRELESLGLRPDSLSDNDIAALGGMSSLRSLRLSLPDQGFDAEKLYKSLASLHSLKYLSLQGSFLDSRIRQVLSGMLDLETVDLFKPRGGVDLLEPVFASCVAKRVSVGAGVPSEEVPFQFSGEESTIEDLTLNYFGVSSALINSTSKLQNLRNLTLNGNKLPAEVFPLPAQIRSLGMLNMKISLEWFQEIADLSQLDTLCLSLDPTCTQQFCSAGLPVGLKSLRLMTALNDDDSPQDVIAKVASLPKLTNLSLLLFGSRLPSGALKSLAEQTGLKDLEIMCSSMKLSDLTRLSGLEILTALGECDAVEADASALSRMNSLKMLVLTLSSVPDGLWDAMAKMPALEKVEIHAPLPQVELDAKRAALHAANPKLKFIGFYSSLMPPK
ncbi:MAG: hypothetical protein WC712_08120 [Candidatus Brocadiia bacterium]